MKIIGETTIFKNEQGNYSTSISNKKEDGTYENMYIAVNFRKGIEVENKTKIDIKDSFMSFYKTKEGFPKIKIVVMSFEHTKQVQSEDVGYISVDSEGLPF